MRFIILIWLLGCFVFAPVAYADDVVRLERIDSTNLLEVRVVPTTSSKGEFGMRLSEIKPGSFWERIGVREHDIWLRMDKERLDRNNPNKLLELLGRIYRHTQEVHELEFERDGESWTTRFQIEAPLRQVAVYNLLNPNSHRVLSIPDPYCQSFGFTEWPLPPLDAAAERACDEERLANFVHSIGDCFTEEEMKLRDLPRVGRSFDIDGDRCVTCNDLAFWKQHLKKLNQAGNRTTEGSSLSVPVCPF